jgi:delta(3,5)-delta(2,4)-dienoyl-CoA isomerase
VIAAVHGVAIGLPLDALCAVDVCWAASDASISTEEVDVGLLAADKGMLAGVPKPVGNGSPLHEFAQSARTIGAEEAWRMPLGLASRVVARRTT